MTQTIIIILIKTFLKIEFYCNLGTMWAMRMIILNKTDKQWPKEFINYQKIEYTYTHRTIRKPSFVILEGEAILG